MRSKNLAWLEAVAILVCASVVIGPIGIWPFAETACVTLAHFPLLGPTPPYGRSDLPLGELLKSVVVPLTIAAASFGVWYWQVPPRGAGRRR